MAPSMQSLLLQGPLLPPSPRLVSSSTPYNLAWFCCATMTLAVQLSCVRHCLGEVCPPSDGPVMLAPCKAPLPVMGYMCWLVFCPLSCSNCECILHTDSACSCPAEAAALPLELVQGYLIDMTMPAAGAAALQDSAFAGDSEAAASSLSEDSRQGAAAGPHDDSDLPAAPVAGCTAEAGATQVVQPDQGAILESGRHGPDGRAASGSATEGRPEAVAPAEAWPEGAPSLLGPTYLAARGCREVVVGATKRYGLTPQQALQECGRPVADWASRNAAKRGLLPKAAQLWEPLRGWQVRPQCTACIQC